MSFEFERDHSADRLGFHVGRSFADHVTERAVLEHETVQLSAGEGTVAARQAVGRDLALFQNQIPAKMTGHVVIDPAWIMFMLPIAWRGDYLFNGVAARPGDIFMSCDPSGYVTLGEARDSLAVRVRKSRLTGALRALSGGAEVPPLDAQRLAIGEAKSISLRRQALAAMNAAACLPARAGRFTLPQAVEDDFISLLSAVISTQPDNCVSRDPGQLQPLRIVRAAMRAHDLQPGQGVSLAQLCETTGVGQTWLSKCFREVCGVSPMAYLRARRLSQARAQLLDEVNTPVSVKDVALSLGFIHRSRFAVDYAALFKEKPSETLLRAPRN